MELKDLKHIHFVGIKGVAMTSLAICAKSLGIKVTGSDTKEIFVTDNVLKEKNIGWEVGFDDKTWEERPDLIIYTGAHGGINNKEVVSAKNERINVMSQAEALNFFSKDKKLISVCGVGGKTSISSMIASIFSLNQIDISYAIGVGKIYPAGYGGNYSIKSKYFICEADEFVVSPGVDDRPKFSLLSPFITVVTNIEHDHPDVYPSIKDTKDAFLKFFNKIPSNGLLIAYYDNKNTMDVISQVKNLNVVTYGFEKGADWQILDITEKEGFQIVNFIDLKKNKYLFKLKVLGKYNVLNALGAFIAAKSLGIEVNKITNALEKFIGVQRRFEKIGTSKSGILVYDDYAHHPSEIKNVIGTAKISFPEKRIISIFQPHTYSRTKSLFNNFSTSFKESDVVILMDIYSSAREEKDPLVSSEKLAKEISKTQKDVYYVSDHKRVIEWLKDNLKKNDLVITIGAGDVFYLDQEILKI